MKWLADENLRNAIIRGIVRRAPAFDILRVQDIPEVSGSNDLAVLNYATAEGRVVITHDLSTMVSAANTQLRVRSRCTPILFVPDSLPIGVVIEEILLLNQCSVETDWAAGVLYLPLQ